MRRRRLPIADIFKRFLSMFATTLLFSLALFGADPLDGVWRSQGYGYVFELHGATLKAFDITDTTCVESFSGKKQAMSVSGREATFRGPDGLVLSIRSGGAPDHRMVHIDGASSDIRIDRLPRKPSVCEPATADTPLGNFDVFAR